MSKKILKTLTGQITRSYELFEIARNSTLRVTFYCASQRQSIDDSKTKADAFETRPDSKRSDSFSLCDKRLSL